MQKAKRVEVVGRVIVKSLVEVDTGVRVGRIDAGIGRDSAQSGISDCPKVSESVRKGRRPAFKSVAADVG